MKIPEIVRDAAEVTATMLLGCILAVLVFGAWLAIPVGALWLLQDQVLWLQITGGILSVILWFFCFALFFFWLHEL